MPEPSVKGLLLIGTVRAIRSGIKAGTISRETVELMLEPADLEIFDSKIEPTRWYPVGIIGRTQEVLAKLIGGDRLEAFNLIGSMGADLVRDTGTYKQMEFNDGELESASGHSKRFFVRKSMTLHHLMFNFGTSRIEIDEATRATLIHYEDIAAFPESMRYAIRGFTQAMAQRATGEGAPVELEAVGTDRFTLRLTGIAHED